MAWKKMSMNFDDVVVRHSAWKRKLHGYIAHPDQSLNAREVAADDRCKTGKWLRGEGRRYSVHPEYAKLVAEHARFHRAAAEIVGRANNGEDVSGEFVLGVGSEFSLASAAVVLALMDMKRRDEIQEQSRLDPGHVTPGRSPSWWE